MNELLSVCELFKSIQGESTFIGLPCIFIRLSGCNLSCTYCDTRYAQNNGTDMSIEHVCKKVEGYMGDLVEITGGEPLAQKATPRLIDCLINRGKTVLVETNGSLPIYPLPKQCIKIMDIKCPSSGMSKHFHTENIAYLHHYDECKFVIGSYDDFSWSLSFIHKYHLPEKAHLLMSPVFDTVQPADLADWILACNIPIRLQLQLHKCIWGNKRGV